MQQRAATITTVPTTATRTISTTANPTVLSTRRANQSGIVSAATTDSTGVLAERANEKRTKTIMNCFRDRTPSYSRSNSRNTVSNLNGGFISYTNTTAGTAQQTPLLLQKQKSAQLTHEAVVYLNEPRGRTNLLTLLKSTSTRDLRTYIEEELTDMSTTSTLTSNSNSSTTSPSSTRSSGGVPRNECERNCRGRIQQLERSMDTLCKELDKQKNHILQLETKLIDLTNRMEDENASKVDKSKKSVRKKTQKDTAQNNVQPSKLTAWMNLSNLWKHRPSIETLKQQNIYNDEPCFDTEVELVLKHEIHKMVPKIVVDCCDLIEEKYRKSQLPIEGLYRQCGDYNQIQSLRFKIDANDYDALRQPKVDIHVLTGVLKLFLREIKSPLISTNEAKTFIGKPNQWLLMPLTAKVDTLRTLILSLPEVNRDTADYLFAHFNRLTKVPLQQISAETLSLSVTPSIFHTVQGGMHMQDIHVLLKESEVLADAVKVLIEYHKSVFGCIADERRRSRCFSVRRLKKTLSHPDLLFQNVF